MGTGEVRLRELLGPGADIPVLELWHFKGEEKVWREICNSLKTEAVSVGKFVLNDVSMTDQLVPHITESLVHVRFCLIPQILLLTISLVFNAGTASWKVLGSPPECPSVVISGANSTVGCRKMTSSWTV